MRTDGIPRSLVGATGSPGSDGQDGAQGLQGDQGAQGEPGPTGADGPMSVEWFLQRSTIVTLPNTEVKQVVFSDNTPLSADGSLFALVFLSVRGHSASNDIEFDIEYDGTVLDIDYVEEHKDNDAAQKNWRMAVIDLGFKTAGNKNLSLRFSKETAGGTAQLKAYTTMIVRYA